MAQTRSKVRGGAKATTDHEEIRRWVEQHGGRPATVKRTSRGNQPGILRIDFPGYSGEQSLAPIEWDEWFERFDNANLAFLYQDETGSGRESRFNKLVSRDTVNATSRRASSGTSAKRRGRPSGRTGKASARAKSKGTSRRATGSSRPKRAAGKKRSTRAAPSTRTSRPSRSNRASRTKRTGGRGAKGRAAKGRSRTRSKRRG
jgi:hypothetical protein